MKWRATDGFGKVEGMKAWRNLRDGSRFDKRRSTIGPYRAGRLQGAAPKKGWGKSPCGATQTELKRFIPIKKAGQNGGRSKKPGLLGKTCGKRCRRKRSYPFPYEAPLGTAMKMEKSRGKAYKRRSKTSVRRHAK